MLIIIKKDMRNQLITRMKSSDKLLNFAAAIYSLPLHPQIVVKKRQNTLCLFNYK